MKAKSFYLKVAGILFLMYFHLILITAINIRKDVNESLPGLASSHASGIIDPIPEQETESCLEDWMFDIDYLNGEEPEHASAIEVWMLDVDYLRK